MKAFADKVKEARVSLGLSQTQLAQEVGVSPRSVQAYERGEKTPRAAMMAKLAKALKVSVRFLADDECEDPVADIEKSSIPAWACRLPASIAPKGKNTRPIR